MRLYERDEPFRVAFGFNSGDMVFADTFHSFCTLFYFFAEVPPLQIINDSDVINLRENFFVKRKIKSCVLRSLETFLHLGCSSCLGHDWVSGCMKNERAFDVFRTLSVVKRINDVLNTEKKRVIHYPLTCQEFSISNQDIFCI